MTSNERARLEALRELELDKNAEQSFDDITRIAANICDTPISLITLIDENIQWTKSRYGLSLLETKRDHSFCSHTIKTPDQIMIVENTLEDDRFKSSPLVTEDPKMRFYAGMSLVTNSGHPIGAVCVIDSEPKKLNPEQCNALTALSRIAMKLIYAKTLHKRIIAQNIQLDQKTKELLDSLI
ncbi:MAG: GAF domain-containing protein [Marinoscillum sp.]